MFEPPWLQVTSPGDSEDDIRARLKLFTQSELDQLRDELLRERVPAALIERALVFASGVAAVHREQLIAQVMPKLNAGQSPSDKVWH